MPNPPLLAESLSGLCIHRTWCNDLWRHAEMSCIVAIPARDEADRIARCLASLSAPRQPGADPHGVLLFVNGTRDDTFDVAVAHGQRHRLPLCVIDGQLPEDRRDAGTARLAAMTLANGCLDATKGMIFTTDADSTAPDDWIATYRTLLAGGCDVVAGMATISTDDACDMPRSLKAREQLEQRYAACLDALECRLDPVTHDPWPRHYHASGANLALRHDALTLLLRETWPACGEDRYIVDRAEWHGLRVRHDTVHRVLTSGRIFGRARGGMADTMRRRILAPESVCDERLEAPDRAYFRARSRRLFRDMHRLGVVADAELASFARRVRVSTSVVGAALGLPCFAAAWSTIEQRSPRLVRELIRPGHLLHHCTRGESLLAWLETSTTHAAPFAVADAP